MRVLIVALLMALLGCASPASAAFAYYKQATLNGSTQAGATDSTNWPLTIALDGTVQAADADLKVVGSGGFVQSSSGYDIRPYSDSGLTSALTYQLVFYDGTTGKLEMHVLMSTLHHSSNDVIYLAFGDASIVSDGSSSSTWNSNYTNVYHLSDGSTLSLAGSTATPANLTNVNTATAVAGEIDGAGHFVQSSNQYLVNATAATSAYPVTLEAWAKLTDTSFGTNEDRILLSIAKTSGLDEYWVSYFSNVSTLTLRTVAQASGVASYALYTLTPNTSWHHIVGVFTNATTQNLYYDGVSLSPDNTRIVSVTPSGLTDTYVGALLYNTSNIYSPFKGDLDEARISNVALGVDYILATYNAQKSSSTFITWGSKVPVGGGGTTISRLPLIGVGK